jgi:hypothetical protein
MNSKKTKNKNGKESLTLEKKCNCCNQTHSFDEFYSSESVMNKATKRTCVCKACVRDIFKEYLTLTTNNTRLSMYYLFRLIDVKYDDVLFNRLYKKHEITYSSPLDTKIKMLGEYLRNLHTMLQYKGSRTFIHSDMIEEASITNNVICKAEMPKEDTFLLTSETIARWGHSNRTEDDYRFLERHYKLLLPSINSNDPRQVLILEDICNTRLEAEVARKTKRVVDYEKLMGVVSKLMGDAGIKPKDDEKSAKDIPYGEWIRRFEEERPIPEASPEFKDVDSIMNYITKWFTSQFSRIFGLSKDEGGI